LALRLASWSHNAYVISWVPSFLEDEAADPIVLSGLNDLNVLNSYKTPEEP
jgi:hypothetical protein